MDKQYSVKFFTSFVEAMQKLCREYLDFDQGVELSGYLAVEIDNFKKERYVLSEMLQSNGSVISESYCTKAFKTLRKELPRNTSRSGENMIPRDHMSRTDRSHSEEVTIVLRESPETVLHRPNYPIHMTTPRKQMSSINQRHSFHSNQRTQASGSRIRDNSSVSATNPFESSSPSSRVQQRDEGQQLQIMPRALEAEMKDSSWNASSESDSPHAVVGSPSSITPRSPTVGGQKRVYQNTDSSSSPGPVKKDKVDESLQSLFDAAREIAEVSQADIDTMKNNYPGSTSTSSVSTTAASASTTTTSTSNSVNESIRLPLPVEVKLEKEDDIPYMVIDNPSDTEVKTFPGDSMFGGDQVNASVYSGDQASTSQGAYGDSVHPTDSPGGASWDMGQQHARQYVAYSKKAHSDTKQKKVAACNFCRAVFARRSDLLRHQRCVHLRVLRFQCPQCDKGFARKDYLTQHLNVHHRPCLSRSVGNTSSSLDMIDDNDINFK